MLLEISTLLLQRGRLAEAEPHLRAALPLLARMKDRPHMMSALALLAWVATDRGQTAQAGRLWGAIEAEEARAPDRRWAQQRTKYAEHVLGCVGPEFERSRKTGSRLSLMEALEDA